MTLELLDLLDAERLRLCQCQGQVVFRADYGPCAFVSLDRVSELAEPLDFWTAFTTAAECTWLRSDGSLVRWRHSWEMLFQLLDIDHKCKLD